MTQLPFIVAFLCILTLGSSKFLVQGFVIQPRMYTHNNAPDASLQASKDYHHVTTDTSNDNNASTIIANLDKSLLGIKFIEKLQELHQYKLIHGDCSVPRRYGPLGNFVNKQRQLYRKFQSGDEKSSLTPERIKALNDLGFEWTADAKAASKHRNQKLWLGWFEKLKKYHREHGTCRIPSDYDDVKLATWVKTQRKEYRRAIRGEKSTLNPERIALLSTLDFEASSLYEDLWDVRIQELRQYKKLHGDTLVPISYAANPSLAQWVSVQRRNYTKYINGETVYGLNRQRIDELNDLGFVWNVWNYREHELQQSWGV
mmetsp:Transcript_34986/g.76532  ORF Transcript_34986/g.76532 Transcript_34986/m.76532 type:complete len:315 (-) Transcript_34986:42-986(-)|eukprot:CAMPEP_0178516056 /NCGR_PEP_ID=MMETSP0696-20121128/24895_1 /TAXON_ID=265572 /ORGANISM="Extubocellulus spinifer, Strain CCMP396" /LENGTH=314 /DNA_ID=CAMNT_0020146277 /DNA_START=164 /DNA_END=1108 /DNA_ORIENTATION=+